MGRQGNQWQLQDAKARLSEVVRCAKEQGPQTITVRGQEEAVVVSFAEYARLRRPPRDLVDVLLHSPLPGLFTDEEIDELFSRNPNDTGRDFSFDD